MSVISPTQRKIGDKKQSQVISCVNHRMLCQSSCSKKPKAAYVPRRRSRAVDYLCPASCSDEKNIKATFLRTSTSNTILRCDCKARTPLKKKPHRKLSNKIPYHSIKDVRGPTASAQKTPAPRGNRLQKP